MNPVKASDLNNKEKDMQSSHSKKSEPQDSISQHSNKNQQPSVNISKNNVKTNSNNNYPSNSISKKSKESKNQTGSPNLTASNEINLGNNNQAMNFGKTNLINDESCDLTNYKYEGSNEAHFSKEENNLKLLKMDLIFPNNKNILHGKNVFSKFSNEDKSRNNIINKKKGPRIDIMPGKANIVESKQKKTSKNKSHISKNNMNAFTFNQPKNIEVINKNLKGKANIINDKKAMDKKKKIQNKNEQKEQNKEKSKIAPKKLEENKTKNNINCPIYLNENDVNGRLIEIPQNSQVSDNINDDDNDEFLWKNERLLREREEILRNINESQNINLNNDVRQNNNQNLSLEKAVLLLIDSQIQANNNFKEMKQFNKAYLTEVKQQNKKVIELLQNMQK